MTIGQQTATAGGDNVTVEVCSFQASISRCVTPTYIQHLKHASCMLHQLRTSGAQSYAGARLRPQLCLGLPRPGHDCADLRIFEVRPLPRFTGNALPRKDVRCSPLDCLSVMQHAHRTAVLLMTEHGLPLAQPARLKRPYINGVAMLCGCHLQARAQVRWHGRVDGAAADGHR